MPKPSTALLRCVAAAILASVVAVALAQQSRELVIAIATDVSTFDPHTHHSRQNTNVKVNIFDYPMLRDMEGNLQPGVITHWEAVDDLTWRLLLRDDVLFHDGAQFTAEDVKYTLERVALDESLMQHPFFNQIASVEIVGDFEVLVHSVAPDPLLPARLNRRGFIPRHYHEAVGDEEFARRPIGTGPFRMVEWRRDERIVLEAFDDYWQGRPAFDRVIFRVIPEASTRVAEVISGGVHIAPVLAQDIARVESSGAAVVVSQPVSRVMLWYVNTDESVETGDPRVREAIEYAIDNDLIVEALFDGYGTPTRGRITEGIAGAPAHYFGTTLYDPDRARELLAQAGFAPGELTLKLQGARGRYPMDGETVEIIGAMLQEVGVNVEFEFSEWADFSERVWHGGDIQHMAYLGLGNSWYDGWFPLEPQTCTSTYFPATNWCNEEFDALVNAAEFEMDVERRLELLGAAFDIVIEERPIIAVHQLHDLIAVNRGVDWTPRPDEMLYVFDATPRE